MEFCRTNFGIIVSFQACTELEEMEVPPTDVKLPPPSFCTKGWSHKTVRRDKSSNEAPCDAYPMQLVSAGRRSDE